MINNIQNNQQWKTIRATLNQLIDMVNAIESENIPISFDSLSTDTTGVKLTKGSFIIFQSSDDNQYYKIDIDLFNNILSQSTTPNTQV